MKKEKQSIANKPLQVLEATYATLGNDFLTFTPGDTQG